MIITNLLNVFNDNNVLVKVFRIARDRFLDNNTVMDIIDRSMDGHVYNLPTCNDVAALILGDNNPEFSLRDIIVEYQSCRLRQINELNPYGEDGCHPNIKFRMGACIKITSFRKVEKNDNSSILFIYK